MRCISMKRSLKQMEVLCAGGSRKCRLKMGAEAINMGLLSGQRREIAIPSKARMKQAWRR